MTPPRGWKKYPDEPAEQTDAPVFIPTASLADTYPDTGAAMPYEPPVQEPVMQPEAPAVEMCPRCKAPVVKAKPGAGYNCASCHDRF